MRRVNLQGLKPKRSGILKAGYKNDEASKKLHEGTICSWYKIPVNIDMVELLEVLLLSSSHMKRLITHMKSNHYLKHPYGDKGTLTYKQWCSCDPEEILSISFSKYKAILNPILNTVEDGEWGDDPYLCCNNTYIDLCKKVNWTGKAIYVFGIPKNVLVMRTKRDRKSVV